MTTLRDIPSFAGSFAGPLADPPPYRDRNVARRTEQAMRAGFIASLRDMQDLIVRFNVAADEYIETDAVITPLGALPGFECRMGGAISFLEHLSEAMEVQVVAFGGKPQAEVDAQAPVIVAGEPAPPAPEPRDACTLCGKATQVGLRRALGDGSFVHHPDCSVAPA